MSAPAGQNNPMPENSPPEKPASQKPTLADNHWRATLRGRSRDDLENDMLEAIEKNNGWRFHLMLQLDVGWADDERFMAAAIRAGNEPMFFALCDSKPGWEKQARLNPLGEEAARGGRLEIMKFLVEKCALDIHYYSDEALRVAVAANKPDMVAYLASQGADLNTWNGEPLRTAAEEGYLEIVKILVEKGAELTSWNGGALERAAQHGQGAVVEYLLSKGADPAEGNHAAFMGAAREGRSDILKIFIRHGVSANVQDGEALLDALASGHFDTANVLLAEGADINAQNGKALRNAAYRGEAETARFLLERNANPNLSEYRNTALTEAVRADKPEIIALLLQHGADSSQLQSEAWHIARRDHKTEALQALVDGERACLERQRAEKTAEFAATFIGDFTIDDLRRRKGPSGDTGLLIAAQTGQFAELVGKARGGLLQPEDLFHPDDRVDSVMSLLLRHKTLQDFFHPAFWTDRVHAAAEAHHQLPEKYQKRVNFSAIVADLNQRNLRKKAQGNGKLKPPGL